VVAQSGALIPGSFAFATDAAGEQGAARHTVEAYLEKAGLHVGLPGAADYVVQLGVVDVPAQVGLYQTSGETVDWRIRPGGAGRFGWPLGRYRDHISVVLLERATGHVVFSGSASLRTTKAGDPAMISALAEAALTKPLP